MSLRDEDYELLPDVSDRLAARRRECTRCADGLVYNPGSLPHTDTALCACVQVPPDLQRRLAEADQVAETALDAAVRALQAETALIAAVLRWIWPGVTAVRVARCESDEAVPSAVRHGADTWFELGWHPAIEYLASRLSALQVAGDPRVWDRAGWHQIGWPEWEWDIELPTP